ncbi:MULTISPECIES: phosphatase PAP2 family protein [Pontibacter]|uniref:PAP2 superfamily protein n=1 Tax=Pontibacter virosus TaxID=1765052 RepID=A0A2U1APN9_9BACT|nr:MULTISPECIES: phosphatase PAP2 family protein [Pontibacter]MCJ8165973.1 phosphatase PAP2 family protein [Pontibacter sp. E15-1]PVY38366.1 PAP2 superfamily protein [Pontibacter virosus]
MALTTTATEGKAKVKRKNALVVAALSVGYLLLSYLLVGFKSDQLVLVGLANALYFATPITRKFITGFSIFIVFWVLYDYMKAFPNYWFNAVHIKDLYNAEKAVFGIRDGGAILTPNEFWQLHSHTFLDVLSGIFYLSWIPVPLAFAGFLFFWNRQQFVYFSLTFLLVNLLGFVVYYLYPAAPPWYVQLHGFDFIAETPGNTAGLVRFDEFFGIKVFYSLYAKGSNVFAAMPSLHSAYPLIVLYYALKNRLEVVAKVLFTIITGGIWFAAVYTSHHYVLDVLAGIVCATTGILLFNGLIKKDTALSRAVKRLVVAVK